MNTFIVIYAALEIVWMATRTVPFVVDVKNVTKLNFLNIFNPFGAGILIYYAIRWFVNLPLK